MAQFQLDKELRLKSKRAIDALFANGKRLRKGPIVLVYNLLPYNQNVPFKVLVTVSKKNFKKAVDRNLLKRRMREALRLEQELIEVPENCVLHLGLIYTYRDIREFNELRNIIKLTLRTLKKQLSQQNVQHEKN